MKRGGVPRKLFPFGSDSDPDDFFCIFLCSLFLRSLMLKPMQYCRTIPRGMMYIFYRILDTLRKLKSTHILTHGPHLRRCREGGEISGPSRGRADRCSASALKVKAGCSDRILQGSQGWDWNLIFFFLRQKYSFEVGCF